MHSFHIAHRTTQLFGKCCDLLIDLLYLELTSLFDGHHHHQKAISIKSFILSSPSVHIFRAIGLLPIIMTLSLAVPKVVADLHMCMYICTHTQICIFRIEKIPT